MSDSSYRRIIFYENPITTDPDDEGERLILSVPRDVDPNEFYAEKFGHYPSGWYDSDMLRNEGKEMLRRIREKNGNNV